MRVAITKCDEERAASAQGRALNGRATAQPGWGLSLPRSDELLARLVRSGAEAPFRTLYERYQSQLYRYCYSILRNEADAQDALQSTFTRALVALREGRRNAPLRPWLYRIAHNESISVLRARGPLVPESECEAVTAGPSVEEHAEERARLELVLADLAQLTERARAALVMRELSGLSHEDIAAALGVSVGGAKQAIFEARNALFELAQGRAMACDEVRHKLSDGDRRVLRGRQVRAHLRDCASCSAFAAAISSRPLELRALFPALPPAAAAVVLTRALEGATGHGGRTAVGASASSSSSTIAGSGSASAGATSTAASAAKMLAAIVTPKALMATAVIAGGAAVGAGGLVGSGHALSSGAGPARGPVAHARARDTASGLRLRASSHPASPLTRTLSSQRNSNSVSLKKLEPTQGAVQGTSVQNTNSGLTGAQPGSSTTAPGSSTTAPGSSTTAPDNSGAAPGTSAGAPGTSAAAPGNSGSAPGHSGSAPGHSPSAPGHSGSAPGQSGTPTSHTGTPPGLVRHDHTPPGQTKSHGNPHGH